MTIFLWENKTIIRNYIKNRWSEIELEIEYVWSYDQNNKYKMKENYRMGMERKGKQMKARNEMKGNGNKIKENIQKLDR